jgi:uncharacterized protein (TIGR02147 family)
MFGSKIGVTKSYLKLVIDKKSHVRFDKIFAISDFFKLTEFERQYIAFLVLENTTKTKDGRAFFKSILKSYALRKKKNAPISTPSKLQDNCRDWVRLAILELVWRKDYKQEVDWIQQILGGASIVSASQIKNALQGLVQDGFLFLQAGKWQTKNFANYERAEPWDDEAGQAMVREGLSRALLAVENLSRSELHNPCRYHQYCLGLSQKNVQKLMDMMDEFEEKIKTLGAEIQTVDRVVFISNNSFCISKITD